MPTKQIDMSSWVPHDCKILDAEYIDDTDFEDNDIGEEFISTTGILLTIQIIENDFIMKRLMTGEEVRGITGFKRDYTARELIYFAKKLAEREAPIKLLVPPNPSSNILDVNMFSPPKTAKDEAKNNIVVVNPPRQQYRQTVKAKSRKKKVN